MAKCSERGGVTAEVEGVAGTAKDICNGVKGDKGDKGDQGVAGEPWTPESQLPPGATETGTWAFSASDAETEIWVPISFTVPLPEELEEEHVHYQTDPDFTTKCPLPGSVTEPHAPAGELCVYTSTVTSGVSGQPVNATFQSITQVAFVFPGASPSGAVLHFEFTGAAGTLAHGSGSWAVTAPLAGP